MRSQTGWPGDTAPNWPSMSIDPALTGMACCTTVASVARSNRSAVKTMPGLAWVSAVGDGVGRGVGVGADEGAAVYPAHSARSISPRDTASTTTPWARISRSRWTLALAFCA